MTNPAATPKTVERCPDCDRPRAVYPSDWRTDECRARWYVDSLVENTFRNEAQHLLPCQRVATARLRSELATSRETAQSVVEYAEMAKRELATLRQSSERQAKLTEAERAIVGLACEYRTGVGMPVMRLINAVDALLALRAQEATNAIR